MTTGSTRRNLALRTLLASAVVLFVGAGCHGPGFNVIYGVISFAKLVNPTLTPLGLGQQVDVLLCRFRDLQLSRHTVQARRQRHREGEMKPHGVCDGTQGIVSAEGADHFLQSEDIDIHLGDDEAGPRRIGTAATVHARPAVHVVRRHCNH